MQTNPLTHTITHQEMAAVPAKPVEGEAESLSRLNPGRDQILARLWQLANLSPEATRGSITNQIKALTMIVAIEGLIPDRRHAPTQVPPANSPVRADIYRAEWLREQQDQPTSTVGAIPQPPNPLQEPSGHGAGTPPAFAIAAKRNEETSAAPQQTNVAPSPNPDGNPPGPIHPFIQPDKLNRVPDAEGNTFDAIVNTVISRGQPLSLRLGLSGRRR